MKTFCCVSILLLVSTTLGEEVDTYYLSSEVLITLKENSTEGYTNSSSYIGANSIEDERDYSIHGPNFPSQGGTNPSRPISPPQDGTIYNPENSTPTHRPQPDVNPSPSEPTFPSENDTNYPVTDPNDPSPDVPTYSPEPAVYFYPTPSGPTSSTEDISDSSPNSTEQPSIENVPDYSSSESTSTDANEINSPPQDCTILLPNEKGTPLLLYGDKPFHPGEEVAVNEGDTIYIACPGGNLESGINQTSISATCLKHSLYYNQNKIDLEKLTCDAQPQHSARYTGEKCDRNGKEIELGYQITPNFFQRLILVCYDDDLKIAVYSHYNITGNLTLAKFGITSSPFIETGFYNLSKPVSEIYSLRNQRSTINKQIGLPEYSTEYIEDENYHITEGQLTSRKDFDYQAQQEVTLNYVNVVPIWRIINSGNWEDSEICTRIAARRKGGLMIYTGFQEVAVLRHKRTRVWTHLYLYNEDSRKAMPVPRLLWRVLYHPETQAGVAIVTFNNPHEFHHFTFCNDVSRYIRWLGWDAKRDNRYGDSYACEVDDLRDYIKGIPYLKVRRLLV